MGKKKVDSQLIVEQYKKRFAQIMEYTMKSGSDVMVEDGEDMPQEDPNAAPQDPNMGGEMPMDGGMEQPAGDMGAADPNAMGQDPNMGGEMSMDASTDVAGGFNPQVEGGMEGDMGAADPNAMGQDTSMMQPDDEVVDITDLTDSQEETQEEIEQMDSKFAKAIEAIKSLESLIKANDNKIDALEAELKKRNPTPMEKMSNRAANSYPFNVSPSEYWSEKEKTSNYSTDDDKNGKESEQYTITAGDINNSTDWKSISDTLSDDFMYNQTLEKLLKM